MSCLYAIRPSERLHVRDIDLPEREGKAAESGGERSFIVRFAGGDQGQHGSVTAGPVAQCVGHRVVQAQLGDQSIHGLAEHEIDLREQPHQKSGARIA